ncbi:Transmembrane protein [Parasponia andersonii]|uniref:Transmembrane protein n=1 Tax=Parasponia andersonii TaxID=3476 RepID=A0A2P5CE65_PARAD|nr:Transmembrane protein [Parasponia andersonii]
MENPNPSMVSEKKKPYLGTFGIIKSAIEIPLSSSTFFFFTFLTSLPLFWAMLLPKLPFPVFPSLLEAPFLSTHNLIHDAALLLDFTIQILSAWLFDFIRFIVAITTVRSVSMIHTSGIGSISLRNLVQDSIAGPKWTGPILTFLYMSLFSSASLNAATYWGGWGPLVPSRTLPFHVVHGITYAAVMVVWCHFRALCKVGVVFSILEGKSGLEAFSASADLIKGNKTRGTILMVLDMAWRLSSGLLPTLFPRSGFGVWYEVLDAYLMCYGRVMNWVVLVIYYYDCKNRQRGNKNKDMVVEKDIDEGYALVHSIDMSPKIDMF